MFHFKIFRTFLVPRAPCAGAVFAAATLTAAEGKPACGISKTSEDASKTESCKHCHASPKLRPSELPLYGGEQDRAGSYGRNKKPCSKRCKHCKQGTEKSREASESCLNFFLPDLIMYKVEKVVEEPSVLEQTIGAVRKELWVFYDQYKGYQQKVLEVVETGKAHSESTLSFLREEATNVHRAGAIGLGGLGGLVMGLRSGWFKRLIYGTSGASVMAALCYPRESAEIADQSLQIAKYYFTIAYNFIYGVKPDGFKFLSPPTVHSDKPSTKSSAPPVPDQTTLPVDKQETPPTPSPVPQVEEEYSKAKRNPPLKVTFEEIVSNIYSNVSAPCSCPDPAISSDEVRYPNCGSELDRLGEMMSDVVYWGFRFVNVGSLCW